MDEPEKRRYDMDNASGVVTVSDWIAAPNGEVYKQFWCACWDVVTDADFPTEKFRSSEKWQLFAITDGRVKMVIPGCQVRGWMSTNVPIPRESCYNITQ